MGLTLTLMVNEPYTVHYLLTFLINLNNSLHRKALLTLSLNVMFSLTFMLINLYLYG